MAEENKPETAVVRHEVRVVGVDLTYGDTIISAIPAIILLGILVVGLYALGIEILASVGSSASSLAPW